MINEATSATKVIEEAPLQGFFELTFSNSKKHGFRPIRTYHAVGALFRSGRVYLDTDDSRVRGFSTLSEMTEYFDGFGYYRVTWLNNECPSD